VNRLRAGLFALLPVSGLQGKVDHHDRVFFFFLDDADKPGNHDADERNGRAARMQQQSMRWSGAPTPASGNAERIVNRVDVAFVEARPSTM